MNELKSLKQVSTPQGRARAWIRMALNDNLLEEYCTSLVCLELTRFSFYSDFTLEFTVISFFLKCLV